MEQKAPSFLVTGLDSPINQITIVIVGNKDGQNHILGSGVILGSHIAITARHVFEGYIEKFHGREYETVEQYNEKVAENERFSLDAFHFVNSGKTAWKWSIRKVYYCEITDIVFIQLYPTNDEQVGYRFDAVKIEISPPMAGETIAAFGYICSKISQEGNKIKVFLDGHTATGIIEEVHFRQRDNFMLKFPCFRTDARFDGGMSGGPVMNSRGELCGIICSNMPPASDDPHSSHTSYVTLLWPMLAIPVGYNLVGFPPDRTYPASLLAAGNFISCANWNSVEPIYGGDGKLIGATFVERA